ncbi:MAG: endonuclease/exonuclease/phosphatase family protein [Ignavibacteriales bacterium]|nr:endonuclease/exonuclease/phosphatase family protein [Ignavibacteriales bacterium]
MKKNFLIFVILFFVSNLAAQNSQFRIMTYNIRYANNNPGEEWEVRKPNVAEMIRFHSPDIFGVQEALLEQVEYLKTEFSDYQQIGVGRDDGKNEGEFSTLFISNKFEVLNSGTFWLSENPDVPSKGWDASLNRIVSWAVVKNKINKESLFVACTHFDHMGIVARVESAKLIVNKIKNLSNGLPSILMGDFNFSKEFEGYKIINESGIISDSENKSQYRFGTDITFNGFENDLTGREKIDFIFVSDKIDVLHHAVIGDKTDGKYPSDHMPVIIDICLKK